MDACDAQTGRLNRVLLLLSTVAEPGARGDSPDATSGSSRLLAWLQLFRAPNVFTAIADVTMGYVFVAGGLQPLGSYLAVAAASCLLYLAGMVLNDVYDAEIDAQERPGRPLPSGRIPRRLACRVGYGMVASGVVVAAAAGYLTPQISPPLWRSGAVAVMLAAAVIGYDAVFKQTLLGPFVMGSCRFLNVLLGMSCGAAGHLVAGYGAAELLVAAGIGVYIVGVTWFARSEAVQSRRGLLVAGVVVMVAGICLLAFFPRWAGRLGGYRIEPLMVWPLVMFLLMVTVLRRCLTAIVHPSPRQVQSAVKQCILSLIVLDAAVCLLVADWWWAVGVLALLLPTVVIGKWIYST